MATAEEYAKWIVANRDKQGTPEFDTVSKAYQQARGGAAPKSKDYRALAKYEPIDPTADMGQMDRFNAGIGKAFTDIGQGAAQMVGMGPSAQDVRNRRELDKPLMNTGAGLGGNIAGNVTALAPMAVIPGAATIAGAGTVGALAGALQPTETPGERVGNMGVGGALGAGTQAATYLPTMVKNAREAGRAIIEPLSAEGRDQIIGRALNKSTGGQQKEVISRLQNATELVPGSSPTAGQAAGNAGIAAIERTATATNPTVMELSRQRMAAQNAARTGLLDDLAGTGGQRNFFADAREATAKKLYDVAYEAGVDLARDATTGKFLPKSAVAARKGEITKLMQTPSMQDAVAQARRLMADDPNLKGKLLDPQGSVQGLDYTRRALSDMIGDAKPGSNQARILMNLRDRLDTTLNTISPKYAEARTTFAKMSQPINQMDIAAEISKKSRRPLDDQLMPAAYARALSDDTAASATGFNKATLEGSLTPRQQASLQALKADLSRSEFAKNAGRGVGSDTVQKLAMSNLLEATGAPRIPSLLSRPAAMGKWAVEKVYGAADRDAAKRLAEALLDPQETARIMAGVKPSPQSAIDEPTRKRIALVLRSMALPAIPELSGGQ